MHAKTAFFSVVTLAPIPLLVLGTLQNAAWIWAALLYLTIFTFSLDELVNVATQSEQSTQEFPAANGLSITLALLHFPLLGLAIFSLVYETEAMNSIAKFIAFGLFFGQISNSNAHDLIHRRQRLMFELGKWVFISQLFGHHTSAHRLIHHKYVATRQDPNTARSGENFYHFALRAWVGSFRAGLYAETKRRTTRHAPGFHPYLIYIAGAALFVATALLLAGPVALLAYILLVGFATLQILMSDYVQHYGLLRVVNAENRAEAVGKQHAWNAPHWFSGFLMLNAPRHSDHHINPNKPFTALEIDTGMPTLPYSLAIMGFLALFPHRWRKLMNPRVAVVADTRARTGTPDQ